MKYKTKKTLKTLALSVLGIGAIVGVASGINTLVEKNDTELKTIIPIFEVGGLKDSDGKYEKTDGSIYTRDAFECQGLEIELDFDNTIKYQVFYYENDGDFISSTDVLLGNQELSVPLMATHARLEITPNWSEMGEDYKKTEDQMIKWYEVAKYSTQMEVKVNIEQKDFIDMLHDHENLATFKCQGRGGYADKVYTITPYEDSDFYFFEEINVTNSDTAIVKLKTSSVNKITIIEGVEYKITTIFNELEQELLDLNNVIHVDGEYSYYLLDTSNSEKFGVRVSVDNVDTLEIYVL